MSKSRRLGLVGGLGVGATVHYYREFAKAHEARGRTLDIVIVHAETSRVFERVGAGDREGLAEYLNGFIRVLKDAGAEVAAIPAVTAHYCVRELVATSPLPILSIFEPLVREISARGVRRVALFGTRFVIESRLFGFAGDVEICMPRPDEVDYIHKTYTDLARDGRGTEAQFRGLTELAHTLERRDGVDAIVLAGTDLAVIFNEANTEFPYIDCAALHIRKILSVVLGETPRDLA